MKRQRTAKAAHHYQIKGKAALERSNARLSDPNYNMSAEYALPVNAFLEPNNPLAVFPQVKKPDILDFRCHKMAGGAQQAIGCFRKVGVANKARHSKYAAVVRTAAEIEAEEAELATVENTNEMEVEVFESKKATKEDMDELAALTEKMTLEKQSKKNAVGGTQDKMSFMN